MSRRQSSGIGTLSALGIGAYFAFSGHLPSVHMDSVKAPTHAARVAIRYAEAQIGKPYIWGGTGPGGYDCSGLTEMAYASAGVHEPRTAAEQWDWGTKVPPSQVKAGDEAFFAGSDGSDVSPGHVGLVINPRKHLMVEAYATGTNIRISHYGPLGAPGDTNPVGFTRPSRH